MIRILTITLFVVTPLAAATGWYLSGPLLAAVLLLGLPLGALTAAVVLLHRSPERSTQELVTKRDSLRERLDG